MTQASAPLPSGPHIDAICNVEAEQALLGACLITQAAFEQVAPYLEPDHFFEPLHGRIFGAIADAIGGGRRADAITLGPQFAQDETARELGQNYLARLAANAITIHNADDYGRAIYEMAQRRDAIVLMQDGLRRLYDPGSTETVASTLESLEDGMAAINRGDRRRGGFVPIGTAVDEAIEQAQAAFKRPDGLTGTPTGLRRLDAATGGLQGGTLTILAARPGMGKSAVAAAWALCAARAGHGVAITSLEMESTEWALRWITDAAWTPGQSIAYSDLARGRISSHQFHAAHQASMALHDLPIWIDDTPGQSVPQIRARLRSVKRGLERRGVPLGMVVVDHLGLTDAGGKGVQKAYERVSDVTRGLKVLAKELGVPVVALCQLNRAVEGRDNKRPTLADLRDSGSIEQDADAVIFVYRDEYYRERDKPSDHSSPEYAAWLAEMDKCRDRLDLIIAKQRQGARPVINCDFDVKANALRDDGIIHPADDEGRDE